MKKRNLLSIVLVVLLIAVTGLSFAYWDNLTASKSSTISVGEGTNVTVNAVAVPDPGKKLIPAGALTGPNDVTEVVLTYNVNLSRADIGTKTLTVTPSNVLIGGADTYATLVNINITNPGTVTDALTLITVTVTLTEPTDQTTYNAIINQAITFDLTFAVS